MDRLAKVHHSLIDWDYEPGATFVVTNRQFVSAPTSLGLDPDAEADQRGIVYLGDALGSSIPIGKIITWHRYDSIFRSDFLVYWRRSPKDWTLYPINGYSMRYIRTSWTVQRHIDGVGVQLGFGAFDPILPKDTWFHVRLIWFEYLTATLQTVLRVVFDMDIGAGWVNLLTYDDNANALHGQEINRVGFRLRAGEGVNWQYIDDTEIWGPA